MSRVNIGKRQAIELLRTHNGDSKQALASLGSKTTNADLPSSLPKDFAPSSLGSISLPEAKPSSPATRANMTGRVEELEKRMSQLKLIKKNVPLQKQPLIDSKEEACTAPCLTREEKRARKVRWKLLLEDVERRSRRAGRPPLRRLPSDEPNPPRKDIRPLPSSVYVLTRYFFDPPRRDQLAVCASQALAVSILDNLRKGMELKSQLLEATPVDASSTRPRKHWIVLNARPDISFQTKISGEALTLEFKVEKIPLDEIDRSSDGEIVGFVLREGDLCVCQVSDESSLVKIASLTGT